MSVVLSNIRKRWGELVKYRRQNLTVRNADEHYEVDVRDLVRIIEALHKTCCQLNMKWHEAAGKEPKEFQFYYKNFDVAIDRLIMQDGMRPNGAPKEIIKPDG